MKPHFALAFTALLIATAPWAIAAEQAARYQIMMTAPAQAGSTNPLFEEPCTWPILREKIDGYKYYGRELMMPPRRRLDAQAFARFTTQANFVVGVEFGHIFLPPQDRPTEHWQHWLAEAVAEIQPIFDAGGRVDTVHIDGPIRRLLGFGGGGEAAQTALPYDEAVDQFVRFWIALEQKYPGIRIGYLVNFPNWDYTADYPGLVGHFTDKTGKYFHDILADFHKRLTDAGGTLSFVEVDCPYWYYSAKQTLAKDAPLDNPGKIRALERWCDARGIRLHMIVNEACLSPTEQDVPPERFAAETKKFSDHTMVYVQALKDDGITPDVFVIQSWYGVPKPHIPETQVGTMTHAAAQIAAKIRECFGQSGE